MSTTVLRRGMATELDGVGVTTRTECWSELLVCVLLVIRGTASRFSVDGVIWRTITKHSSKTENKLKHYCSMHYNHCCVSHHVINWIMRAHEHASSAQSSQQMCHDAEMTVFNETKTIVCTFTHNQQSQCLWKTSAKQTITKYRTEIIFNSQFSREKYQYLTNIVPSVNKHVSNWHRI